MRKVTVRRAAFEDASQLVAAEQEIAKEPGVFCSLPSELSESGVREAIQSSWVYLVAEIDRVIVGHGFFGILLPCSFVACC